MQVRFQVTIQHRPWGRVLKSCPPPPYQASECFINLNQPPTTQHPRCIQVLSCSLCKGRHIPVRSEKDQANTLHPALMTFATSCNARLHTHFLIAPGRNPDWQCIIQQLSFLWTLKDSNYTSMLYAYCKAWASFGKVVWLAWGLAWGFFFLQIRFEGFFPPQTLHYPFLASH